MKIEKALEVKKALLTLSEVLNLSFNEVAANVCFLDKGRHKILIEASNMWNKFDEANIVERGKMLGINVTMLDA